MVVYPEGAYSDFNVLMTMLRHRPSGSRDLSQLRKDLDDFGRLFPLAPNVICKPRVIAGRHAECLISENSRGKGCILYLHGGGYVAGSITSHRHLASYFASATACMVVLLDYRLAPESPFPSAILDVENAYESLLAEGFEASGIAIIGDSAGGGLAISLMTRLKKQKIAMPGACICLSPWLDLNQQRNSWFANADYDILVDKQIAEYSAGLYLQGRSPSACEASPLFADLEDLPPFMIHVGSHEVLLDDASTLHKRAKEQGVDSTLEVWADMPHVWHFMASILPEGRTAIDNIASFLQSHNVI